MYLITVLTVLTLALVLLECIIKVLTLPQVVKQKYFNKHLEIAAIFLYSPLIFTCLRAIRQSNIVINIQNLFNTYTFFAVNYCLKSEIYGHHQMLNFSEMLC